MDFDYNLGIGDNHFDWNYTFFAVKIVDTAVKLLFFDQVKISICLKITEKREVEETH